MTIATAIESDLNEFAPPDLAPRSTQGPLRCVLMDDSRFDRRLLLSLAEDSRYELEFVETSTISETRAALAQRSADILVLDNRVPDGCGIEFADSLRREAQHYAIPVIVISDDVSEKSAIQAMRSGAADYLAKDELTTEVFDAAVESALRRTAVLPADQTAMLSNLQAENETLRRISLRNMRLLKAQAMPLMAFAWKMVAGGEVEEAEREIVTKKLARLTRNMTGLIDDTVITAATHRANEQAEPVNLSKLISDLVQDETNGLRDSRAHLRVGALPTLLAKPIQMAMLFEELLLNAIRAGRLGHVPEIEIGAGVDPEGNPVIWLKEDGLALSARKQAMGQRASDLIEPPAEPARDEHSWSLCQRLVEKNNGKFKISNDGDNGSRIMIRFPKDMVTVIQQAPQEDSEIA